MNQEPNKDRFGSEPTGQDLNATQRLTPLAHTQPFTAPRVEAGSADSVDADRSESATSGTLNSSPFAAPGPYAASGSAAGQDASRVQPSQPYAPPAQPTQPVQPAQSAHSAQPYAPNGQSSPRYAAQAQPVTQPQAAPQYASAFAAPTSPAEFATEAGAEHAPGWAAPIGAVPATGSLPENRAARRNRKKSPLLAMSAVAVAAALIASFSTALLVKSTQSPRAAATSTAATAQLGSSSSSTVEVPVASSSTDNPDWQKVVTAVSPSVVSIKVTTASGEGEGSGVIVDSAGLVLTNDHVVGDATKVTVTLTDGRIFDATIVGTDATTDLAVVRLKDAPDDLKAAVFADSDTVQVGDPVMAVGNPLGLSNTATTGIVSALNRPVSTSSTSSASSETVVTNAIQIDAAINPGNSGGPLFNAQGEVVGITSSIATMSSTSSSSGSIGLGFAIPSNVANMIGEQLISSGKAEHAYLGVMLGDGEATADGATRQGAKIEQVVDGSPAATAGLKAGDVVVAVDSNTVSGAESLTGFVRAKASGSVVKLTVVRDSKEIEVSVTLQVRADSDTSSGGSTQQDDQSGQDGKSGQSDQNSQGGQSDQNSQGGQGFDPFNPFGDSDQG
ncbi:S1C family serine protease [Rarobacter incanus]|uniref:Putative serine protease PepD n=1 Tax=Rarobacter incanus TaxID=153494 RepID=A0A542SQW0_9MICO|nr:trypsin-like peptidase domain-containing protein [Rarobacter incanus]TQK77006.1 putative serine protease PepD [Rarobacter incanus]